MSPLSSVAQPWLAAVSWTPPDISKQGEPECGADLMIWDEAGIRTRPRVASHLSYFFWIFTQPRISTRAIIYRYKDLHTIFVKMLTQSLMWFHIRNFNSCIISGNKSDLKHDKGEIIPHGWRIIQTEKEQQAKSRFCMNDIIFNGRQVCAQLGNSVYAIQTVSGMWHCGPCQVGLLLKTSKHNVTSKVNALNHP